MEHSKRNIGEVSPASSAQSPDDKRLNPDFSTPANMAATCSISSDQDLANEVFDVFHDAPPWARVLDIKLSRQLELLTTQTSRIDNIESDLITV